MTEQDDKRLQVEPQTQPEQNTDGNFPLHDPSKHTVSGVIEHHSFLRSTKGGVIIVSGVLLLLTGATGVFLSLRDSPETSTVGSLDGVSFDVAQGKATGPAIQDTASTIDYTKLPLGDDKYSTSPQKGYVYSCQTSFNGGGASEQGPWINADGGTWNLTEKISVDGDVGWPDARWSANTENSTRVLTSVDLPIGHTTGTYPIDSADDAYQFDRNPNSISEQDLTLTLPLVPTELGSPKCISGEVGIALTGVLIFSAFDAGGHDAVATEVQDHCQGHPQAGGYYHYHGYSSCFEDNSAEDEHSDIFGYAYDGFGIFGLRGENGIELSSDDLDECHGHKHNIDWDGEKVEMYHYHFTQDFPYTVSCFKGEPLVQALSSGEGTGSMMGNQMNNMPPQEGSGPGGPIGDLPPPPTQ